MREEFRELLETMRSISEYMPLYIYENWFNKIGKKEDYLLCLFSESFRSTLCICNMLDSVFVCQTSVIIRLLLESVGIINILSNHPELLEGYKKHVEIRLKIADLDKKEKIDYLQKEFPDVQKGKLLSYMDYGWIEPIIDVDKNSICEKTMLELANLSDVISWKEVLFDKLAHQSFTLENLVNKNGDIPAMSYILEILCKLFDYLCCNFYKLTKFEFIINGQDLFQGDFRKKYKDLEFHD